MAVRKKGRSSRGRRAPGKAAGARASVRTTAVNIANVGHQVWLAGLGALARAQTEGPKLFESLVEEGSAVHERQRERAQRFMEGAWEGLRDTIDTRTEGMRSRASDTLENLEKIFQSRVQKALQQLGMPTSQEIHALTRKVNEQNRSVQTLAHGRKAPATRGASAKAASEQGAVI